MFPGQEKAIQQQTPIQREMQMFEKTRAELRETVFQLENILSPAMKQEPPAPENTNSLPMEPVSILTTSLRKNRLDIDDLNSQLQSIIKRLEI